MIDHKESMAKMREFTNEHLVECCAELLHWHKESILPDGKVRELAALCTFDEYNRLTQAERMIELAALERVARGPRHETEGVFATDGSGPFDCYACGKKAAHPSACELEAVVSANRDKARLDYMEKKFSGCTNRERYLPVQMLWGVAANGRTLREACDKYMARDGFQHRGDSQEVGRG